MSKPFLSFEDQINKLKVEKELSIPDLDYAERTLKEIGYFGLIGGYKEPFKNPTTKKYRKDVCFEDIVTLYKFDENMRELLLKYILKIERHLRSMLSYYFSEKHGECQSHYLNKKNYSSNPRKAYDVSRLIGTLEKLANESCDYPYINHQRQVHKNVPLWVLINGMSFGNLSKFYSLVTPDIQAKVSQNFDMVNEKELGQYLSVMTKFRNVCAHNERLFAYKTRNDIPNTNVHKGLNVKVKGTQYIYGKHDLFAVVIAFKYLIREDDFNKFISMMKQILDHFFSQTNAISRSYMYEKMGFPENWEEIEAINIDGNAKSDNQ